MQGPGELGEPALAQRRNCGEPCGRTAGRKGKGFATDGAVLEALVWVTGRQAHMTLLDTCMLLMSYVLLVGMRPGNPSSSHCTTAANARGRACEGRLQKGLRLSPCMGQWCMVNRYTPAFCLQLS